MVTCLRLIFGILMAAALGAGAHARDFEMGGDTDHPYSIMKPEPGTAAASAHRTTTPPTRRTHASLLGHEKFVSKLHRHGLYAARGSSGSVLPTPLPRTPLIPPEGTGAITEPAIPQEQGPSTIPGLTRSVPNLPHGTETFQDRASRCTFQSSLYGVPGAARMQYMGSCVQ
jgi:hypothetical protein